MRMIDCLLLVLKRSYEVGVRREGDSVSRIVVVRWMLICMIIFFIVCLFDGEGLEMFVMS